VVIKADTPALTLSPTSCNAAAPEDVDLYIRRRGDDCWRVRYPVFDIDENGNYVVIFDEHLFNLPGGRYEAQVRVGCDPCNSFEIILPDGCGAGFVEPAAVRGFTPVIHTEEPPCMTDMFQDLYDFSAELDMILERGVNELTLCGADIEKMCAAAGCCPVELVIYDGIKSEVVTFVGCDDGVPQIERGANQMRFPIGSTVAFSWTPNNVNVACQDGCDPDA